MADMRENGDLGRMAEKPVNWVGLRWECTSTRIALALLEQVRADIKEFNFRSPARKLAVSGDCSEFKVTAEKDADTDVDPICFARESERIVIRRVRKPELVVAWSWDKDSLECRLSLNGGESELWRISQSALYEKLFPKG